MAILDYFKYQSSEQLTFEKNMTEFKNASENCKIFVNKGPCIRPKLVERKVISDRVARKQ